MSIFKRRLIDRRSLDVYDSIEEYNESIPNHQTHFEKLTKTDPLYMERDTFPRLRMLWKFIKPKEYFETDDYNFGRWMTAKLTEYDGNTEQEKQDDTFYTGSTYTRLVESWTTALHFLCWMSIGIAVMLVILLGAVGYLLFT